MDFVGKCSSKFLRVDSLLGFVSMAMIYWTETDGEMEQETEQINAERQKKRKDGE